jgi:regulatory protein YycH of two-component signal transduction system YycFG
VEYCKQYSELSELEYEQCIFNCKDVHRLLTQLAESVKKYCEDEVNESLKERPEIVREKVHKICVGYLLGVIAYNPELVEKLLKHIASNMGIEL